MNTLLLLIGSACGVIAGIAGLFWMWKGTGKKEAEGEAAKKTISSVEVANKVDNALHSSDDHRVIDELRRDWTK